jgi:UDP-N-acetylglucosamine 2-epimerase
VVNKPGSGAVIDVTRPFLLVVFHPTTTEYGGEVEQMEELLTALERLRTPTVFLWPNIDAGADHISKALRVFRDKRKPNWLRSLVNLTPEDYLKVLAKTACAIGNSSSFVRDAGYFGTPVVLIGNRQQGRETGEHVRHVAPRADEIDATVRFQLSHGAYDPCTLYGDGYVSERISEALARLSPYVQKRLCYIDERVATAVAAD